MNKLNIFKLVSVVVFINFLVSINCQKAQASGVEKFLKNSGYGALFGAALGILSLSVENRPGKNLGNITRGASLGLYAGIIYGVYDAQFKPEEPTLYQDLMSQTWMLVPEINEQGKFAGLHLSGQVWRF